jgi:hypothetical protein
MCVQKNKQFEAVGNMKALETRRRELAAEARQVP